MTRKCECDRHRRAGETTETLLEVIVEDVVKAAAMPENDWWALNKFPLEPLLAIPDSAGGMCPVTHAGVEAAHKLTDRVWNEREDYRQTIEREAFNCLSFSAIGQALRAALARVLKESGNADGSSELDSGFYHELAADFRNTLDRLTDEIRTDVDRHIPCTLFHEDQLVPAFSVGPVEFLPRAEWIDRFVHDPEARRVVEQVDKGELAIKEVRRRAMKPDSGRAIEDALTTITCLRGFSWVGTIRAAGHEPRQSYRKMATIVGVAIDAVGLGFNVEGARRFTRVGRAHLFAEDRLATAVDNGRLIHGGRKNVPGVGGAPGELAAKMQAEREFLDAAGEILNAYVESRQKGPAPHLVEAWVNALHWIGEARREVSDFMAVVKYGCAIDGLSGAGGKASAITEFAEAALAPQEGDEPREGARSIAQAVEMVYVRGEAHSPMATRPGCWKISASREGSEIFYSRICPTW